MTDWGGANSRLLGLVSVGAARSLDQTASKCHQKNPSNDVKYITHMQSVFAGKKMEMYTKMKKSGDIVKIIWYPLKGDRSAENDI